MVYRKCGIVWLSLRAGEKPGEKIDMPQTVPPEFRRHEEEDPTPSDTGSDGILVDKTWITGPCMGRLHNAVALCLDRLGIGELPVNMPQRTMFPPKAT
ncbi:MAG: hypothetical protein WCW16_02815 [Candidatus Magasanikbacteria bacterium]